MKSATSPRRDTLNLRIPAAERNLIDRAAESSGKTRTDFILEAARRAAEEALLDRAMLSVGDHPDRWPEYLKGTRRLRLRRFPYSVVYRIEDQSVLVVAVALLSLRLGRARPQMRLPRTLRAASVGAQLQGGPPCLLETR